MVMVDIEPTGGQEFFGALELPIQKTVFSTGPRGQGQTAVSPELSLGAKMMRCLNQSDQQSRLNRADAGNLAKQSSCRMFPALHQQFLPGLLA